MESTTQAQSTEICDFFFIRAYVTRHYMRKGGLKLTSRKSSRSRSNLSSDGDERRVGKYLDSTTVGMPRPMIQLTIHHHIIIALKNLTRNSDAIYISLLSLTVAHKQMFNHTDCQWRKTLIPCIGGVGLTLSKIIIWKTDSVLSQTKHNWKQLKQALDFRLDIIRLIS